MQPGKVLNSHILLQDSHVYFNLAQNDLVLISLQFNAQLASACFKPLQRARSVNVGMFSTLTPVWFC